MEIGTIAAAEGIAGIAGQLSLNTRNVAADQRSMEPEYRKCLVALAIKTKTQGIAAVSVKNFAVMTRPILNSMDYLSELGELIIYFLYLKQID